MAGVGEQPEPTPTLHPSVLRWTLPLDGVASFAMPAVLLVMVPLLAWAGAPEWLIGAVIMLACTVLAGCGAIMAVAMARSLLRGDLEHPEMACFLSSSRR